MNKIEEIVADLEEMRFGRHRFGHHHRHHHHKMMEQMSQSGRGELFILNYLYHQSGAALPSEISKAMHTSTARISAALGSLEKKGQIHREIDTANRRNILVTITEDGRERIRSNLREMKERMILIFTEMGEREAAEFVRLTKRFSEIAHRVFENNPPDV